MRHAGTCTHPVALSSPKDCTPKAHVSCVALRRVDKTHMPKKYEMKTFMEKEFARRLLAKKMVSDFQAQVAGA